MRKLLKQTLALATSVAMCLSVASPVLTVYAEDATAPTTDSYVDAGDTADVSPFDSIAAPDTSDTDTEAANAEAANAEAADTEAADTEAADTEPADTEAADTEPADTETTDTEAADTETADAEPAEPEPEAQPAEPATPETAAEPLAVLDPESTVTTANVGDTVTLSVDLNREDVEVTYQWQVMRQPAAAEIEPVYQYAEDAPTWYNYPLEDKPEADLLAENPAATWQGMETYLAIVDALDEIGEDSSNASLAWRTENYALEGYAISAARADDQVQIYADKDSTRYTATLNSENKWEFDTTEGTAAYSWQDIEGATNSRFSFEVTESDFTSSYRCAVTVTDADYLAQCARQLADSGTELTDEQLAADQVLYSLVMTVESPEAATPETAAVEDIALYAATGSSTTPHLSADAQWIEGLNNNFEYITKDTYDRISQWLAEGKIDDSQAKRYWTGLFGWKQTASANVLDADGFPTGELRTYFGVTLTNGALEVNSEWYGKTVYFRVHGSTGTGTAVNIPAYTDLTVDSDGNYVESSAGTKYKKAVTFLNPFVPDTGSMYSNFLSAVSTDGWLLNMDGSGNFTTPSDIHIRVYTVNCESFNSDPARYMVDAEGNYRMDSVGWGVCTSDEPDLSGKAYWQLKDYIANGYGFLTGHDTLYAYAGAYYDAYGTDLDESSIDPNDGTTWYYSLNSWLPYGTTKDGQTSEQRGGHFYMNQLMGSNKGNVNSSTVSPSDAPGLILSTGGSHGVYGKNIQYGSESIHVAQTGYSAAQALQNPKYRTPTNYPYSFSAGQMFPASFTHTNQQAAFGTIWADYSGGNKAAELYGYYTDPRYWTINNQVGTNNFYLSGNGNYLMNQIGHLPTNAAYSYESALFANSVMYVSQRKQCEICAANQSEQETVHFVRRISSTNFKAVTDALRNGGSYWYPLDGCYMLTEDITLPEDWTPIAGFTGHWNSDVYKVTLNSKGTPLLANTSADGPTGWNLGTDPAKGTPNVFDANMTRTTGVARVLGDLNDLFGTKTSYAGYVVKILGSDNPAYMQRSEVYSCTVNSDSKYVISNLPCIYDADTQTGVLTARVYRPDGSEVTEYGAIRTNVSKLFWDNDETTPLYLGGFTAEPVQDEITYESAQAFFVATATADEQPRLTGWQSARAGVMVGAAAMAETGKTVVYLGKATVPLVRDMRSGVMDAKQAVAYGRTVVGKQFLRSGGNVLRSTARLGASQVRQFRVESDDFATDTAMTIKDGAGAIVHGGQILVRIIRGFAQNLGRSLLLGGIAALVVLSLLLVNAISIVSAAVSTSVLAAHNTEDVGKLVNYLNQYRNEAITEDIYNAFRSERDPNGNPYGYTTLDGKTSNNLQHGVTWNYANGISNDTAEIISMASVYFQQDWPPSSTFSLFDGTFFDYCRMLTAYGLDVTAQESAPYSCLSYGGCVQGWRSEGETVTIQDYMAETHFCHEGTAECGHWVGRRWQWEVGHIEGQRLDRWVPSGSHTVTVYFPVQLPAGAAESELTALPAGAAVIGSSVQAADCYGSLILGDTNLYTGDPDGWFISPGSYSTTFEVVTGSGYNAVTDTYTVSFSNAAPVAWCPGELQDSRYGHYDLDCTIYMAGCDSYAEPETAEPDGDAGGSGNLQALAAASNGGSLTRTVRKLSYDGTSYTTGTTQRYTKTVTLPQPEPGFTGWDADAIEWAELLYKMDWEDLYHVTDGIKCRTVGTRLTDEELAAILQALGLMDGSPRAQIVGFALTCQGRFSYGQPTSLRGSAGAAIVGSDLDCSSFIQYCYWSLGLPFSAKTTANYAGAGDLAEISPSQIQPGDLRVVYASGGTQGHVQMYVGGNAWIECAAGYGVGLNLSNGFMTSRPCHYFSYVGF